MLYWIYLKKKHLNRNCFLFALYFNIRAREISFACNALPCTHAHKKEEKQNVRWSSSTQTLDLLSKKQSFISRLIWLLFSTFLNRRTKCFIFFFFYMLMNPFALSMFVGRIFNIQNEMWYSAISCRCFFWRSNTISLCDDDDDDDDDNDDDSLALVHFDFVIRCFHLVLTCYSYWSSKYLYIYLRLNLLFIHFFSY